MVINLVLGFIPGIVGTIVAWLWRKIRKPAELKKANSKYLDTIQSMILSGMEIGGFEIEAIRESISRKFDVDMAKMLENRQLINDLFVKIYELEILSSEQKNEKLEAVRSLNDLLQHDYNNQFSTESNYTEEHMVLTRNKKVGGWYTSFLIPYFIFAVAALPIFIIGHFANADFSRVFSITIERILSDKQSVSVVFSVIMALGTVSALIVALPIVLNSGNDSKDKPIARFFREFFD
ncbi:hypothetical protein HAU32_07755 [Weissella confusa]|uniref:Uncharacterized protein n=1 Tax=Weissella fermenti TaxID=2987699 RepID=A0ABT6D2C6_9LACO|nr:MULTISPECIES: hypothetical protein [Weissella]MBJ7688867.1 hypothetical protein [Weissella confusa]MCW0927212.1 hypothetical protein [Weissella sp. LMG 11983]MDF9299654.1 hypothetical protein [Weissella sp. BK2]